MLLATDLYDYLVEVPPPVAGFHALDPAIADLGGEHRAKPMPPETDRLVADINAALVQQVLDVSKRQREPDVQHTASRMISGLVLNHLKALGLNMGRG